MEKMKIGLIGLGAMGLPMGKRLLAAGHDVAIVPHVRRAPADELAALGAEVRAKPRDLTGDRSVIITSLPDVPQVQEILFGEDGLLDGTPNGNLIFLDMSTINPTAARDHHSRLAEIGVKALDAPVSGGPMRATDGTLTIMVGGDAQTFEAARTILEVLGKNITHVGDPGAGQAVKLVNQLMISIIMVANAEALTLGVRAGVPLQTMLEVIGTASGSNYLMQNWMPRTLFSGNLAGGFATDLLVKDLNAALHWASDLGLPTFGGSLVQQLYRLTQHEGHGKDDYSAVTRIYEEAAGVELRLTQD